MYRKCVPLMLLMLASLGIASAQVKVGIVNMQSGVLETAEIKKAQVELETKFKPRTAEMTKMQTELQQLQAELQSKQGKITPAAEQEIVARGQRRQRELQRFGEDLQGDVDRERNDILQRSSQRFLEVVRKLAEERGLDMVVDASNTLYMKPALDLTKDAVAAYDKAYPAK